MQQMLREDKDDLMTDEEVSDIEQFYQSFISENKQDMIKLFLKTLDYFEEVKKLEKAKRHLKGTM